MPTKRAQWACREAAAILEQDARDLRASHTLKGRWVILDAIDRAAREEFDRRRAIARQLHSIANDMR